MADAPSGLLSSILAGYPDFRASARARLAARPRDAELLMLAFLVSGVGFVTGLPGAAQTAAGIDQPDALIGVLAGRAFAALFLVPLFLFALSGVLHLGARLFGGAGDFYAARVAVIWAVVLALPLVVLNGLASAMMLYVSGPAVQVSAGIISLLSSGAFLWILAGCLAAAEDFRHTGRVFSVLLVVLAGVLGMVTVVAT